MDPMLDYQVLLYKAKFIDGELGWQIDEDEILWCSQKYHSPVLAIREWDFFEPEQTNWFVTMVEREGEKVLDEEIFDSSVIEGYDGSPL
jgi:hypothetical protein